MLDFYVCHYDTTLAHVIYDETIDKLIEVEQYFKDKYMRPIYTGKDSEIDAKQIKAFIKSRCLDEDYIDLQKQLLEWGLLYYEPEKIIKQTHGIIQGDFIWLKFKGENILFKELFSKFI